MFPLFFKFPFFFKFPISFKSAPFSFLTKKINLASVDKTTIYPFSFLIKN
jgi:hypothetical protein